MNRYVVLGVTATGITRLASRRGWTPNEAVDAALTRGERLLGGGRIIVISVGDDYGKVGDTLNVVAHLVRIVPRPDWELVRIG